MKLISIDYSEHAGLPDEWVLDRLTLQSINLLVGRNATGKSRVINVIHNLSLAINGKHLISTLSATVRIAHGGQLLEYSLKRDAGKTLSERLTFDGEELLIRDASGKGQVYLDKAKTWVEFDTPSERLELVARQDKIQHPRFMPLFDWADSVYCYRFGTSLGHDQLAVFGKFPEAVGLDGKNPDHVVGLYAKGVKQFGEQFVKAVKSDFAAVGYDIDDVGIEAPPDIPFVGPGNIGALYVKEKDLACKTFQNDMSVGMFRALSLIVHVSFNTIAHRPTCILVDDIGEGLDFERASALIKVLTLRLRDRAQLIMTTNHRFVINAVPLTDIGVLFRTGGRVSVKNYENSKEAFDAFETTGLNNFDFFATDYAKDHEEAGSVR